MLWARSCALGPRRLLPKTPGSHFCEREITPACVDFPTTCCRVGDVQLPAARTGSLAAVQLGLVAASVAGVPLLAVPCHFVRRSRGRVSG